MLENVPCLDRNGLRIIISDERAGGAVPKVRRLRAGIPVADESLLADELAGQLGVTVLALESLIGLIDAVVERCDPCEAPAVKRHPQHDLVSRNPCSQILLDRRIGVAIRGRCVLGAVQTCMVAGRGCQTVEEVIAHQVDPVEIDVKPVHLGVVEILPVRRGDCQGIAGAARASLCGALGVQLFAQCLQEQGEIALVLGAILDSCDALPRVLPIQVYPVRGVVA